MAAPNFPRLTEPGVFIASPRDVQRLRNRAVDLLNELQSDIRDAQAHKIVAYEIDDRPSERNDAIPAQLQMYRPDDPLCKAVICFFGEQIGTPLGENFTIECLAPLDPLKKEEKDYGLVHPWKPEKAEKGGFALTGSTFELLATVAANRLSPERQPPLHLRFIGPTDTGGILPPMDGGWGNRFLRGRLGDKFPNQSDAYCRLLQDTKEHIQQLYNLVQFLRSPRLNVTVHFTESDDSFISDLRQFLVAQLRLHAPSEGRNIFKGLEYYDVQDSSLYCWLREDLTEAHVAYTRALNHPEKVRCHWIIGPSGCGKSSFIRAGIIGRLVSETHRGQSIPCVMRPNEIVPRSILDNQTQTDVDLADVVLRKVFHRCVKSIATELKCSRPHDPLPTQVVEDELSQFDVFPPPEAKAQWCARRIEQLLDCNRRNPELSNISFLLGFDQFEEFVDMLDDARLRPGLDAVVNFIKLALGVTGISLFMTLRSNRVERMAHHKGLNELFSDGWKQYIGIPTESGMKNIIHTSFKLTNRIKLDDRAVELIAESIRQYGDNPRRKDQPGSSLPLVSVTLKRLYEHAEGLIQEKQQRRKEYASQISDRFSDVKGGEPQGSTINSGEGSEEARSPKIRLLDQDKDHGQELDHDELFTVTEDNSRGYLRIDDAITQLAEDAWGKAKKKIGLSWEDGMVGTLLRRLVVLQDIADDRFSFPDAAIPTEFGPRVLAESLIDNKLLIPEEGKRVRLVHEAVLEHWTAAKSWLEAEGPVHEQAATLKALQKVLAKVSEKAGEEHASVTLKVIADSLFVKDAAIILAVWYDKLFDEKVTNTSERNQELREFCLNLIRLHCRPGELVESSIGQTHHLILAANYNRNDIVREMLQADPSSVNVQNSKHRTAIFAPCFYGNADLLDILLEYKANPDFPDKEGWRPIHYAAASGSLDCLKRLLTKDVYLGGTDTPHETAPIHTAASSNHVHCVHSLVEKDKTLLVCRNAMGQTPLHIAASNGALEAIQVLNELGADANESTKDGWKAVHYAARENHPAVIRILREIGADLDASLPNQATALHIAAHNGHMDVVKCLFESHVNVDAPALNSCWSDTEKAKTRINYRQDKKKCGDISEFDWTPLHFAVASGHDEVVSYLLEARANPNLPSGSGETPLHFAGRHDGVKIVKQLCANGANKEVRDRNGKGQTPLIAALARKAFAGAQALASERADLQSYISEDPIKIEEEWSPLHFWSYKGDTEVVQFLLRNRAKIDAQNTEGYRPLHLAAARAHFDVVMLLLDHGATPDLIAKDNHTPITLACLAGALNVVSQLYQRVDSPLSARENIPSLLHYGVLSGNVAIVNFLLSKDHPVDHLDAFGFTPLHLAIQEGHLEIVRCLVRAGADLEYPARTPLIMPIHLAAEGGHSEIIRHLHENHVPLDAVTNERPAPILLAMRYGHIDAVKTLLLLGAPISQLDSISGESLADTFVEFYKKEAENGSYPAPDQELIDALETSGFEVVKYLPTPPRSKMLSPDSSVLSASSGNVWNYVWNDVPREVRERLIATLTSMDNSYCISRETTDIKLARLSWYDQVSLLRVADSNWQKPDLYLYYLIEEGEQRAFYWLNGTSPPIHQVNKKAPIKLNQKNALDYLRFFNFFVRGEEGPFYIVEDPKDPMIPRHADVQRALEGVVRPATFEGINEKGHFLCDGVVFYSNALFIANFSINPTGMVNMLDDDPIAVNLPKKIELPIS
ncbi:protein of unknown function [Nitrospira japonica]|uniref:Novel STAND NTPase 1 domain-containing protein n=1 Tax=Nitrospira japonica TaxID=1325564 RepID=A0A1W1I4Y8_9BACT|nr:ankyrin repeat domain-containing protein [Nitrospira japonica]SLM48078.1 protein of unknown function [Nitrospira japonica]